jgi:hypothetical protein
MLERIPYDAFVDLILSVAGGTEALENSNPGTGAVIWLFQSCLPPKEDGKIEAFGASACCGNSLGKRRLTAILSRIENISGN